MTNLTETLNGKIGFENLEKKFEEYRTRIDNLCEQHWKFRHLFVDLLNCNYRLDDVYKLAIKKKELFDLKDLTKLSKDITSFKKVFESQKQVNDEFSESIGNANKDRSDFKKKIENIKSKVKKIATETLPSLNKEINCIIKDMENCTYAIKFNYDDLKKEVNKTLETIEKYEDKISKYDAQKQ